MSKPFQLSSDFIVLDEDYSATRVEFTPTLFEELADKFDGFAGHALVSMFSFDADWPTSEMHPAGDEIVVLLSGAVTFVLEKPEGNESIVVSEPGNYVIVPKGTWHTAKTSTPTSMLFITPGAGTQMRAVE